MTGERVEYAIRRLNWRRTHYGIVRMPGFTPFGTMPTIEEAEEDCGRREAEVRARVGNPFICGPTHAARSRLPEPIFEDWLRDAGIEPRQPGQTQPVNWVGWWPQAHKGLSAEQVAHVWAGLDRVRFFEVVARPENRIGYAVVRIEWEYNDNWMEPGDEGGTPLRVFRRWTAAEEYRQVLEGFEHRWRAPQPDSESGGRRYETTRWTDEDSWPLGAPREGLMHYQYATFAHGGEAPFYEVVEIELPDLLGGRVDG
ncbi:MAG: hypothetical protein K2V38_25700 [Gemmataceae bacterium]|nr:hypothetical protein [Gemmataceae bacterium]